MKNLKTIFKDIHKNRIHKNIIGFSNLDTRQEIGPYIKPLHSTIGLELCLVIITSSLFVIINLVAYFSQQRKSWGKDRNQ